MGEQRRARRRVGRSAVAVGLVLACASFDLTAGARAGVTDARSAALAPAVAGPGFGKAQAELLMLDPRSAQLSFGVRFGPTVSDHRNLVARAQAQSTDYGLIGGSLTGAGCSGTPPPFRADQLPQPLRADSREPGDSTEVTVTEGPITQSVLAQARPFARATSRLVEAVLPGVLTVHGATDTTTSGVDATGVALVHADVAVAQLDLLGGVVALNGLHWEATNRAGQKPVGTFTIASATIGGTPVPTQDASALVAAVNAVLSQLGLVILPPVAHLEGDTIFVDPIKVGVAPNATRDQVAGAALEAIQPVREQLFKALLDASCDSAAAITVADILLGSVTGGGSLTVAVGGAQAQLTPDPVVAPTVAGSGGGGAGAGPPPTSGASASFVPPASTSAGTGPPPGATTLHPRTAAAHLGTRSDGALAVGLGTLALGAALVEADRRKMRQAGGRAAAAPVPMEAPPG